MDRRSESPKRLYAGISSRHCQSCHDLSYLSKGVLTSLGDQSVSCRTHLSSPHVNLGGFNRIGSHGDAIKLTQRNLAPQRTSQRASQGSQRTSQRASQRASQGSQRTSQGSQRTPEVRGHQKLTGCQSWTPANDPTQRTSQRASQPPQRASQGSQRASQGPQRTSQMTPEGRGHQKLTGCQSWTPANDHTQRTSQRASQPPQRTSQRASQGSQRTSQGYQMTPEGRGHQKLTGCQSWTPPNGPTQRTSRPRVLSDCQRRPQRLSRSLRIKNWIQAKKKSSSENSQIYTTADEGDVAGSPVGRHLDNICEESDVELQERRNKTSRRRVSALTTRRRRQWRSDVLKDAAPSTSETSEEEDGLQGDLLEAGLRREVQETRSGVLRTFLKERNQSFAILDLLDGNRIQEALSLAKGGQSSVLRDACLLWASQRGSQDLVRTLLESGADVDAGQDAGVETPLTCAVRSGSKDAVGVLIEAGATVNPTALYSETPLHVASCEGLQDVVELLLSAGADVRSYRGTSKMTSLHLAAQEGYPEVAQQLLKAGARPDDVNLRGQTPLHLAAKSQSSDVVQVLLRHGADPSSKDSDGKTPLHRGIFKGSRSYECLKLLLDAGADANAPDLSGYTPLHMAALHDSSYCVLLFLQYGGDVTSCTQGGVSALNLILRRTPTVLQHIQERLDAAISFSDRDIQERDSQVQMDFRVLVPGEGYDLECRMLSCFIKEGQKTLLKHPLCETLLFLKWLRVRSFFVFNLVFYAILVGLLTAYILLVFPGASRSILGSSSQDASHPTSGEPKKNESLLLCLLYFIWVSVAMLTLKESFQIVDSPRTYLSSWDNVLIWPILILTAVVTVTSYVTSVHAWQHHLAAILILLSWVELLLLIGRFPSFGLYVQMFTHVAKNFGRFLFAYLSLLNAFSLSFGVLFPNHAPFGTYALRFLKTLVMMTGEIDYDEWFFDADNAILYPVTSHVLFAIFLVFVTIILMNLLVGLAVSDIQGLQKSAGLDRLVRQTELIAHFESFMFSRWLSWAIPGSLLRLLHRRILLCPSLYGWTLFLNPKTRQDSGLPQELLEVILRTARARDHFSRRRNAFANFRTLSKAAQFSRDADCDVQRSIDALRFGLDLLVWDVDERRDSRNQIKEAVEGLTEDVAILAQRIDDFTEGKECQKCGEINTNKRSDCTSCGTINKEKEEQEEQENSLAEER